MQTSTKTTASAYEKAVQSYVKGGGNEKEGRRILNDVLRSDFNEQILPKSLEFHGFARMPKAASLAAGLLAEGAGASYFSAH